MKITRCDQFNKALSQGPWDWPEGYPIYFVTEDHCALSFAAAVENAGLIRNAIIDQCNGEGWRVIGVYSNQEDLLLWCVHTEARIASAYAEDQAPKEAK